MNGKPVIAFENVSKIYELHDSVSAVFWANLPVFKRFRSASPPPKETKTALSNISFSVLPGEKVGVIGRNGSGKTTLLRLVIGQTSASSGAIVRNGASQALMQTGFGFSPELSGIENVRNSLLYNGLNPAEHAHFIDDILDFVELGEFINYPLRTYSLGMHARLEFATATAIRPDILVIDEVMGAGDGYFASKSANRIRNLVKNSTLMLVSHSLSQVNEFCDRVLWINDGVLMADGPASEVIDRYEDFMAEYNAQRKMGLSITAANSGKSGDTDSDEELFRNSEVVERKFLQRVQSAELRTDLALKIRHQKKARYIVCPVGKRLKLEADAYLQRGETLRVLACIWGYSAQGSYLFCAKSSVHEFSGVGPHRLALTKETLPAGVGEYLLFYGLLCAETEHILTIAQGYSKLRIPPTNYSDPPFVHLEGTWTLPDRSTETARIDAWV